LPLRTPCSTRRVPRGSPGGSNTQAAISTSPRDAPRARRARAAGHAVLFDGGWPSEGYTAAVLAELEALRPHLSMVLPNLAEATGWTGATDPEAGLRALERGGVRAVIKRGAEGASWLEEGKVRTAPAPSVAIADSVGAGDAFNSALLAALSHGAPLSTAVAQGVAYASAVAASRPRRYAVTGRA